MEGLWGLKQDGPKKYLGVGQQILEHFFPKGWLANKRRVQLDRRLSKNAQSTVRSDYNKMEHQFKKRT